MKLVEREAIDMGTEKKKKKKKAGMKDTIHCVEYWSFSFRDT